MAETTVKWRVRVTTGDAQGLFRLLREANPDFWARAQISPTHDEDPDSDRIVRVSADSLAELRQLLDLTDKAKHVTGLVVEVSVEDSGVSVWSCIGRDWLRPKDTVEAQLHIRESQRQTEAHRAIRDAIRILSAVK